MKAPFPAPTVFDRRMAGLHKPQRLSRPSATGRAPSPGKGRLSTAPHLPEDPISPRSLALLLWSSRFVRDLPVSDCLSHNLMSSAMGVLWSIISGRSWEGASVG